MPIQRTPPLPQVPKEVLDAALSRAVRSSGALHDSPPRRMALLLWSIAKLSAPEDESSASPRPPAAAGSELSEASSCLSPKASAFAVDAVLSMTLAPTRLKPYLETCSPSVLALVGESVCTITINDECECDDS